MIFCRDITLLSVDLINWMTDCCEFLSYYHPIKYRKTSDSSRVPYTSQAPDTGRGFKWIVPIEAGSRLHAGSRVQAGSGCKPGESWYLLTYRSQPALTSANMASPKVLKRRLTCTDRSPVLDTGRGLKWIVPIEAGGFYPRFYGSC